MAGWTSPRTWVAGEKPTAAIMNAHIRDNLLALNGYVRKGTGESVTSSTTLQDDDELFLPVVASGRYLVDLYLFVTSAANAAGDIKVAFSLPAGASIAVGGIGADISLASGAVSTASFATGSAGIAFGVSTTSTLIWIHGLLTVTNTGTLTVQWAQNASSASATTVGGGSHLRLVQTV